MPAFLEDRGESQGEVELPCSLACFESVSKSDYQDRLDQYLRCEHLILKFLRQLLSVNEQRRHLVLVE